MITIEQRAKVAAAAALMLSAENVEATIANGGSVNRARLLEVARGIEQLLNDLKTAAGDSTRARCQLISASPDVVAPFM